jgi:hypothetical protein
MIRYVDVGGKVCGDVEVSGLTGAIQGQEQGQLGRWTMDDGRWEWLDSGLALSSVVYRLWSLTDFELTLTGLILA